MSISIDHALRIVSDVLLTAAQAGESTSVAVVDSAGHLLAFGRSADASIPSIDISIGKAYTSGTLGIESGALQSLASPDGPLYGLLEAAVSPRMLVALPGGVPITEEGVLVGGLGVGGSADPTTDAEFADASAHLRK